MWAALIPEQRELAEELDRWRRDDREVERVLAEIRCRKKVHQIGVVAEVGIDNADGTVTRGPFGVVLQLTVYATDRLKGIRDAREDGGRGRGVVVVPGEHFPADDYVVAFLDDRANPLPEQLTAFCAGCGSGVTVSVADVRRALATARSMGTTEQVLASPRMKR